MNQAQRISPEDRDAAQLARTVADIHCDEKTAEQWTAQLAREVTATLSEFYAEITEQMIEHAVCETLFRLSCHLRLGRPVTLEAIGMLLPAVIDGSGERCVGFRPCDGLFQPMPGRPAMAIRLADRRQGVRHV